MSRLFRGDFCGGYIFFSYLRCRQDEKINVCIFVSGHNNKLKINVIKIEQDQQVLGSVSYVWDDNVCDDNVGDVKLKVTLAQAMSLLTFHAEVYQQLPP